MNYIQNYFSELFWLLNEMSPYLVLGLLIAGFLHVYLPQEKLAKFLGKRSFSSVLNASLFGIPLPLCSCGVIPTGVSLYKNGGSKGATVSFMISTPQTGVDSMLATYSLLGLPFALLRPFIAFVTGIFGGMVTNKFTKEKNSSFVATPTPTSKHKNKLSAMMQYAFIEFLQDIAKWLLIGLLIAALIAMLVPDDFFGAYLSSPILGMFIILLASVPLYVCATGSIPIAAVLMVKGLSPGAALVFLMAGPATNAATMAVIGKTLGKKTLLIYLTIISLGAVFFGLVVDYLLPANWFNLVTNMGGHIHGNHILPEWLNFASTFLLLGAMLFGYIKSNYTQTTKQTFQIDDKMDAVKIKVKGMTCNHCKANVENNLNKLEGVTKAQVNLIDDEVMIQGEKLDLERIKGTVEGIGYEYVSKV